MSLRPKLRNKGRGGNQANLNQGMIKEEEIPIPPINIQKEIIASLEASNTRVEEIKMANSRRREILEALPKSILKAALQGRVSDIDNTLKSETTISDQQMSLKDYN